MSLRKILKSALPVIFFVLVAWLLSNQLRSVRWDEVAASLADLSWNQWALGLVFVAICYGVYVSYELLARRYTEHRLPAMRTGLFGFVSYSFNNNMGSIVGALGLRLRLYRKWDVRRAKIARIIIFAVVTNWLGYLLLAGTSFLLAPLQWPDQLNVPDVFSSLIGWGGVAIWLLYVLSCSIFGGRESRISGQHWQWPTFRIAMLQTCISAMNWLAMAGVIAVLMPDSVGYVATLQVLMVAAVAGVITHIPAGLGVHEAIFLAFFTPQVPAAEIVGALLAFRALYYLLPLGLAVIAYITLEMKGLVLDRKELESSS